MKTATLTLKSLSPYNQSKQHFEEKIEEGKESHEDYEKRTWIDKGHYDENGNAFIPPMAFKTCISSAAKYLSLSIPGKGTSKYTKHFESGVMVTDGIALGVKKKDITPQWLSLSPRGKKGEMGVLRAFTHFKKWEGDIEVHVIYDTKTKKVF